MKWSLALMALGAMALLVEADPQRRQEGRRLSATSRPSRRREGLARIPGGREKVMAVQDARARAESDPNWIRCLHSVDEVPRAQHIITGRVEHVSDKGVRVRVKRILKGDALPSTVIITDCEGSCCHLRKKDTRLFLLGTPLDGGAARRREDVYPLVATPLRIRLKTLFMIRAAIKDVPYEHQPPITEEPCEQQFCPWGGECQTDEAGAPFCTCPTTCQAPTATTQPVCGTDGITYETICQLRKHSCATTEEIRINHTGRCDEPIATISESKPRHRDRNRGAIGSDNVGRDGSRSRHRSFLH